MAKQELPAVVRQPWATLAGHRKDVFALAAMPGGKTFLSGGWDGTVRLWDLAAMKELATFPGDNAVVYHLAAARDGKTVAAAGSDGVIRLWDLPSRKWRKFTAPEKEIYGITFDPEGRSIAAASMHRLVERQTVTLQSQMFVWNLATAGNPAVIKGKSGLPVSLAYVGGGSRLALACDDGEVSLWDVATGQSRISFKAHARDLRGMSVSPDGSTLVTGGLDRTAKLWDAADGHPIATLGGNPTTLGPVAFSPDGSLVAAATVGVTGNEKVATDEVRVWEVSTQRLRCVLQGPKGSTLALTFGPDAATVLTGGRDGLIRVWKLPQPGVSLPDPPQTLAAGVAPKVLPGELAKTRLDWRPVAGSDGTWSAVLPGIPQYHRVENAIPGVTVASDIYNMPVFNKERYLFLCQLQVDEFARTPTQDEFESDNVTSLKRLAPQLGFELTDVSATTMKVQGQHARRYECSNQKLGSIVCLRVLVPEAKRTRIFTLIIYGTDATPEIRAGFLDSLRLPEFSSEAPANAGAKP